MKKIQFGFIGAGKIVHSSVANILNHSSATAVGAFDLSEERVRSLCDTFDIPHTYSSAEELLNNAEINAVYIAAPNKFHASYAIQALNAGKNVFLEKPFAMNATEAEEVLQKAKETGLAFMVGMNQRYTPDAQRIYSLARKGIFEDIHYGKAYWFRREGIPKLGTWFGNKELAGAGAINDIGVHMLDLCLHIMGNFEPTSVSGSTYTKFGNRGLGEGGWGNSDRQDIPFDVDDLSTALIKMKNGATVSLETTWACHAGSPDRMNVEIFGTEAGASLYPGKLFYTDPSTGEYLIKETLKEPLILPHCDRFHNFINHLLE
ncbi:MAG: Gfo/Idh/MocA family oxidoreductase, partial [Opitutaceae bacterium]|nr:Gfo/Idh/MocA family oxidoreductase [Opitutaceae bacterium]